MQRTTSSNGVRSADARGCCWCPPSKVLSYWLCPHSGVYRSGLRRSVVRAREKVQGKQLSEGAPVQLQQIHVRRLHCEKRNG